MAQSLPANHPLKHAFQELSAADAALRKMIGLNRPFDEFEAAWRELLRRVERVWTKTEAAVSHLQGWTKIHSEVAKLRRTDPLLQYVLQARNVDEHSVQDVAKEYEWNLAATPTQDGIRISWSPWDRPLLPVVNRGKRYDPPRMHLGKSIAPLLGNGKSEPRVVAELAIQFYVGFMNTVSSEVIGNNF